MPQSRPSAAHPAAPRAARIRTCIATRQRRPDDQLLRTVLDPEDPSSGRVLADPRRHLPGRGAWITPDIPALELAEKRRAFKRAFRTSNTVDTTQVRLYLTESGHGNDIVRKTEP